MRFGWKVSDAESAVIYIYHFSMHTLTKGTKCDISQKGKGTTL
jgi:hypothetical protein